MQSVVRPIKRIARDNRRAGTDEGSVETVELRASQSLVARELVEVFEEPCHKRNRKVIVHFPEAGEHTPDVWRSKWNGNGNGLRPQLYFKQDGDATVVYDSRFDKAVEHRLSPVAIEILKSTEKPRFPNAIHLAEVPDADIEKQIAELDERGLIFWEDGRFVNLVLPGPPPPDTRGPVQ